MKKNPLHEHSLETMVTEVTMAQTLHELKKKKKDLKKTPDRVLASEQA